MHSSRLSICLFLQRKLYSICNFPHFEIAKHLTTYNMSKNWTIPEKSECLIVIALIPVVEKRPQGHGDVIKSIKQYLTNPELSWKRNKVAKKQQQFSWAKTNTSNCKTSTTPQWLSKDSVIIRTFKEKTRIGRIQRNLMF